MYSSTNRISEITFQSNDQCPYKINVKHSDDYLYIEAEHEKKVLHYVGRYEENITSKILKEGYTTKKMFGIFYQYERNVLDKKYSLNFPKDAKDDNEKIIISFSAIFDDDMEQDNIPLILEPKLIPHDVRIQKRIERLEHNQDTSNKELCQTVKNMHSNYENKLNEIRRDTQLMQVEIDSKFAASNDRLNKRLDQCEKLECMFDEIKNTIRTEFDSKFAALNDRLNKYEKWIEEHQVND